MSDPAWGHGRHERLLPAAPAPRTFTRSWLIGAADRAVKSAAQILLLLWSADVGLNVLAVNWGVGAGLAGGAAMLSLLTSVVSAPIGDPGSTSALKGGR